MTIMCNGKPYVKDAVSISWMTWANPHMVQAIQDFNCSHTDVQVTMSVYDNVGDDSSGKLLASVVAHQPPDLVMGYYDALASWAARGELQPLDSYTNRPNLQASEYQQYAWQSSQWLGHTYGIPIDWDPDTLLFYNKQVFKDAGLDPNKPPTTLDQLIADGNKIDSIKNGRIQKVGFAPWVGWEFNQVEIGHLFGAPLEDGSKPVVKIDSPQMREALTWEQQIAKKFGGASNVNSFTTNGTGSGLSTDPLISGLLGMEIIGTWEIAQRDVIGKDKFNNLIGIAPVPAGVQSYICHSGYAFMVPTGSPHASQAMEFVQWIEQDSNFVSHFSQQAYIPAKLSTRQDAFYQKDSTWSSILKADEEAGPQMPWLTPSPLLTQYYKAIENAEAQVISLQMSPQQALSSANDLLQPALQAAITDGDYTS
jgi:multiple sugar transport system substrate-binding protein